MSHQWVSQLCWMEFISELIYGCNKEPLLVLVLLLWLLVLYLLVLCLLVVRSSDRVWMQRGPRQGHTTDHQDGHWCDTTKQDHLPEAPSRAYHHPYPLRGAYLFLLLHFGEKYTPVDMKCKLGWASNPHHVGVGWKLKSKLIICKFRLAEFQVHNLRMPWCLELRGRSVSVCELVCISLILCHIILRYCVCISLIMKHIHCSGS